MAKSRAHAATVSWLSAYAVWGAAHLVTHVRPGPEDGLSAQDVTQWALAPLLGAALWQSRPAPRERIVNLGLAALGFSFLGDALPDAFRDDTAFLVLVGFFLLAQVAYIAAFWPRREHGLAGRRSPWALAYLAAYGLLVAYCAPQAGTLLVPVLVYGACLTGMSLLATGLGRYGTVGGLLFFASDALIAINAFRPDSPIPHGDLAVMATYIAAQGLLVLAILRHSTEPDAEEWVGRPDAAVEQP